jgi:protein-S-isoprenylcysteine O-methyltransferase Ste14
VSYSLIAKKARVPLGFIFSGLYLFYARPSRASLSVGAALALAGLIFRAWASGHIVKNERLAVGGPYAHTRNPLYFGSFLIAAGFALAAHWALLFAVAGLFLLIYAPTIQRERVNIRGRFPEAWAVYEANVPAFLPRLTPWRGARANGEESFSFDLYMKHGEWKAALGYVLAVAWLVYRLNRGF